MAGWNGLSAGLTKALLLHFCVLCSRDHRTFHGPKRKGLTRPAIVNELCASFHIYHLMPMYNIETLPMMSTVISAPEKVTLVARTREL
jgi:hypothetical protein